jgi:hypothetical protein
MQFESSESEAGAACGPWAAAAFAMLENPTADSPMADATRVEPTAGAVVDYVVLFLRHKSVVLRYKEPH